MFLGKYIIVLFLPRLEHETFSVVNHIDAPRIPRKAKLAKFQRFPAH